MSDPQQPKDTYTEDDARWYFYLDSLEAEHEAAYRAAHQAEEEERKHHAPTEESR